MMYLLKYESYGEKQKVKAKLHECGIPQTKTGLLDSILMYAGDQKRTSGLFGSGGMIAKLQKSFTSGLGGVENVYTQHEPLLSQILGELSKGKLKDSAYPVLGNTGAASSKYHEVIVFIVGGATYEEATKISEYNAANVGSTRVVLGGSCVHNSVSFMRELSKFF
jgi:vacuolar protein sorting-associated protein 45